MSKIYDFNVEDAQGNQQALSQYKDKLVLIVNTASKCGFTPQYSGLQELYNTWHARGLEILAFPCNQFGLQEPGSNSEIQEFCQINYGLTFQVMGKIDVNGTNADPLFGYLREGFGGDIKWNFTKFLVGKDGNVLNRYEPGFTPQAIGVEIQKILADPSL